MRSRIYLFCFLAILACLLRGNAQQPTSFVKTPVYISSVKDSLNGKYYFVHTVEQGHTLYSISKAYHCHIDEIIKSSGDNTISVGEALYIPYKKELDTNHSKFEENSLVRVDSLSEYHSKEELILNDSLSKKALDSDSNLENNNILNTDLEWELKPLQDTINISLILPLYTQLQDSLNLSNDKSGKNKQIFSYLPYYLGFKLALDDADTLHKTLYKMDLESSSKTNLVWHVFDVNQDSNTLAKLLSDANFMKSDLIIAGCYTTDFNHILDYAQQHQIPIIHPLSQRDSLAKAYDFCIQTMASHNTQLKLWAKHVSALSDNKQTWVLWESNLKTDDQAPIFYQYLKEDELSKIDSVQPDLDSLSKEQLLINKIHLIDVSTIPIADLVNTLSLEQGNLVCSFTNKENKFSNLIFNLYRATVDTTIDIQVFGPISWLAFDRIEIEYLQKLNLECFGTYKAFINNDKTKTFEQMFYNKYKILPTQLSFQAYDFSSYICQLLYKYNVNFPLHLCEDQYQGIGINYRLSKMPSGNYENCNIRKIRLINYYFEEMP